jgi:hypothetical protein
MAQIGRKPYCKNCKRKLNINDDYRTYTCGAAYIAPENNGTLGEIDKRFTHLKKTSRCPEKVYFVPRWTMKEVREHNNHK